MAASVLVLTVAPFLASILIRTGAASLGESALARLPGMYSSPGVALAIDGFIAAVALCVGALGVARFLVRGDPVALLVGLAMLAYGPFSALHGFGPATGGTDYGSLWKGSRAFLALFLVLGASVLASKRIPAAAGKLWIGISMLAATLVGALYWILDLGRGTGLDQPLRLIPLALFLFGALFTFPRLHRRQPSLLSLTLILAAIPHVLLETLVSFPSPATVEIDTWIGHLLKLLASGILFLGLALDYVRVQQEQESVTQDLAVTREALQSERRQAESARLEMHRGERARHILEQSFNAIRLGVTVVDMEGKILYVNRADADMHGYQPSELIGQRAQVYTAAKYSGREARTPILRSWSRESTNVRKDGTSFPVRLISEPILDRDGSPIGLLTVSEDFSKRKAVERIKEDFLATVSHELRTPLTAIVASLDLLGNDRIKIERAREPELLNMAKRNSERLLSLIDDLLDLQKLRAGKMEFRIGRIEIGPAIESAFSEIHAVAETRNVTNLLAQSPDDLEVLADPRHLHQVLINLLSNAIKYSPHGASACVEVSVAPLNRGVQVSVSDQGPGIPEERLDTLFEPFVRVETPSTQVQPGTGLGLSIVKMLLEGMKGSITIDSRVGVGTTARFVLPRAETPKPL